MLNIQIEWELFDFGWQEKDEYDQTQLILSLTLDMNSLWTPTDEKVLFSDAIKSAACNSI